MYLTKAHELEEEELPWDTLRYLIGEAMYGGRVTCDMDRRVMMCYLKEYLGEFIFDSNQKFLFAKSATAEYTLPSEDSFDSTLDFIDGIPLFTPPGVFGLHSNAEITYYFTAGKNLWYNILSMQISEGGSSGGINKDDIIV